VELSDKLQRQGGTLVEVQKKRMLNNFFFNITVNDKSSVTVIVKQLFYFYSFNDKLLTSLSQLITRSDLKKIKIRNCNW
jgi:hypothetical protein